MRVRKLRTFVLLAPPLCVALACCCGGRAAVQQAAPAAADTPRPSVEAGCAGWPDVLNAAYRQVLEHPAPADKADETLARLSGGGMSVRGLVKSLALSDEYRERFVTGQPTEVSARLLYRHLLAREPTPAELKSAAEHLASPRGHTQLAEGLLDSAQYAERFGESRVPGSPLRPCHFPVKLRQEDSFEGGAMVTDAAFEADGQVTTTTVVKSPSAGKTFCGKVGLWLFDESGNVLAVTGPPADQQWCLEGQGEQERTEQWQGVLPADILLRTQSIAVLQLTGGKDPRSQTRENAERVKQVRRPVK
jgi:hypothetical protein